VAVLGADGEVVEATHAAEGPEKMCDGGQTAAAQPTGIVANPSCPVTLAIGLQHRGDVVEHLE
jgi:hypothetical protein